MAATYSAMEALGSTAPKFILENTLTGKTLDFDNCKGSNGTVVAFIANHCPYVIHVMPAFVKLYNKYKTEGINFIAISSNDIVAYPDDSPQNMKKFAEEFSFDFPYLFDETQEIAKAYSAECTPDFYVFNGESKLVYRGRMDATRPGKGSANGSDLNGALSALAAKQFVSEIQFPSIGCSIKWKN